MSEEANRKNEATIGLSEDGTVCFMTLPIMKYADDLVDGNALIYGKMRELQAHVMAMVNQIRAKKSTLGVIKVNGSKPTDLGVA